MQYYFGIDLLGTGLGGNVIAECATTLKGRSVHQRVLMLEAGMYKLSLVARDYHGTNISTLKEWTVIPKSDIDQLSTNPLILSRQLRKLESLPNMAKQFVLGNIKIILSVRRKFPQQERLDMYPQVYGTSFDQTTLAPVLGSRYSISDELDTSVKEVVDPSGE